MKKFSRDPLIAAAISIVLTLVLLASTTAAYAQFGPVIDLATGTQPHCALGPNGTLHVVYITSSVHYFTLVGGVPSAVETLPGSSNGKNPFICVGNDSGVHVVWDTWSTAYYTNKVGGNWKNPLTLPIALPERNYFAQVAVAPNGVPITSHWSLTKGVGGYNVFCRINNPGGSSPTVTKIREETAESRPPSLVGPSPASAGDNKLHIFIGLPQTTHRTMDSNGTVSSGTNISRTPVDKTVEGMQGYFIGTDPAIATAWTSGSGNGAVVNSYSRAVSGKQGIIAGTGCPEFPFPRAAYCPTRNKVYVLYPKSGKPALSSWVPQQDSTVQLGNVSESNLSSDTRGCGAGGIARVQGGGVHIVYSTGGRIYYRTMDAISDSQPPSTPTNVQATVLSPISAQITWTASTDNIAVAGYKIFRNGVQAGISTTTSYTDSGLSGSTTYSFTVLAFDASGNESPQSSPAAVVTTPADNEAPSVPTNVQAVGQSSSSIAVSWTASTDNAGVAGYRISRNGAVVGTSATTSYLDSGLQASTTYSYTVSAYDASGNFSAQSSPPAVGTTLQPGANSSTDDFENAVLGPLHQQTSGVGWANNNQNYWNAIDPGNTANKADVVEGKFLKWAGMDTTGLSRNFNEALWTSPTLYVEMDYTVQANLLDDNNVYVSKGSGNSVHFEFRSNGDIRERGVGNVLGKWDGTDPRPELNLKTGWKRIKVVIDLPGQKYDLSIGGVAVGTNLPFRTASSELDHLRFYRAKTGAADFSNGFVGMDNIYISNSPYGDTTPPSVPSLVTAAALTPDSIAVSWMASTDNVGVTGYKVFRNGSEIGSSETVSFIDTGLAPGTSYSYQVSAFDAVGNESAKSSTAVASTMSAIDIAAAKMLSDFSQAGLTGKVVTAVFEEYFYIEEIDRYAGLKVVPVQMPEGLERGNRVNVGGVMQTENGERCLNSAFVTNAPGSGLIEPLGMINSTVGGGDWMFNFASGAGQQGIKDAVGSNNISLLVRVWGAYSHVSAAMFRLDDGSGAPLDCVVAEGVELNPDWQYVSVTGISSCYDDGSGLHRLIKIQSGDDIVSAVP